MSNSMNGVGKNSVVDFFERKMPASLMTKYAGRNFVGYDYDNMVKVIDFHKPFLKTNQIAIFNTNDNPLGNIHSIGLGYLYPKDTDGHYNHSIYLAQCGQLMASTASVHLAFNYIPWAPQVVEAGCVKPLKNLEGEGILQPRETGTSFWVETTVLRKKLNFVLTETKIYFGTHEYGIIEGLKFMLIPKEAIWRACPVQEDLPMSA